MSQVYEADAGTGTSAAPKPSRAAWLRKRLLIAGGILVGSIALYVGATLYTNRPSFCGTCHEMTPYYEAWAAGSHADSSCVYCHVDRGFVAGFAHKFVALREVYVHFTENPKFPQDTADVPDARCLNCHDGTIDPGIKDFNHEEHRAGRTCVNCHDTSGHIVTAAALQEAGILNADVQALIDGRNGLVTNKGVPLDGHTDVVCSNCHNMPASTCAACHTPPRSHFQRPCSLCHVPATWEFAHPGLTATCVLCHERPAAHPDGACSLCHAPGGKWAFVHPVTTECAGCHTPPRDHYAGSCASCHDPSVPFAETIFHHPGQDASCSDCHSRPSGHRAGQCSTCHTAAKTWAFVHPTSSACAACHTPPANHYGGPCVSCHTPDTPFAQAVFRHPGQEAPCSDCHASPAGHYGGQCSGCHVVGGGWAFAHPASTVCGNCHAAPPNHYGPGCANCHTPSVPWASAVFSHPAVPGGEHTYRSFPCASCHPNGFGSTDCNTCHAANDNGNGDD